MNFLFLITNLNGGGAERALISLARNLLKNQHEINIVMLQDSIQIDPGVEMLPFIHRLGSKKVTKGFLGKLILARQLNLLFRKLNAIQKIDLVISRLHYANHILKLAKIPKSFYCIDNTISSELLNLKSSPLNFKYYRRYLRYKYLYGKSNLIAISQEIKLDLINTLNINENNIQVIYNLIDFDEIGILAQKNDQSIPNKSYVIHLGRFNDQKIHDLLFEAWGKVKTQDKLVLLVEPSDRLSDLVKKYGIESKVLIAGFKKNPYPWLKNASLMVLSSDYEGLPLVVIEALFLKVPIVSTDSSFSLRALLKNYRNELVICGDSDLLARKITEQLNYKKIMHVNLNQFTAKQIVSKYSALAKSFSKTL